MVPSWHTFRTLDLRSSSVFSDRPGTKLPGSIWLVAFGDRRTCAFQTYVFASMCIQGSAGRTKLWARKSAEQSLQVAPTSRWLWETWSEGIDERIQHCRCVYIAVADHAFATTVLSSQLGLAPEGDYIAIHLQHLLQQTQFRGRGSRTEANGFWGCSLRICQGIASISDRGIPLASLHLVSLLTAIKSI